MDFLRSGLRPSLRKSTVFYHKVTAILILFQLAIAICVIKKSCKKAVFCDNYEKTVFYLQFYSRTVKGTVSAVALFSENPKYASRISRTIEPAEKPELPCSKTTEIAISGLSKGAKAINTL